MITNTHKPETIEVSGTKTWDDNNNAHKNRPESIIIYLSADGEVVETKTVTEKDNWTYEFKGLDKYKDGKEIKYTISEEKVAGYTTEVKGYDVENKEILGELEIIKTTNGAATPGDTEFNITGPNGYSMTVKYSEFEEGIYVLKDISLGEYKVTENTETGEVKGYTLKVNGEQKAVLSEEEQKGSVELVNDYTATKIVINKVDNQGKAVAGAKLSIMDSEGNKIMSFTTGKQAYEVTGRLEAGKTYILHEDKAPEGYEKAKDVKFTVLGEGQTTNVRMVDVKKPEVTVTGISLIMYKVDQDMKPLAGATFKLVKVENGTEKTIGTQSKGPRYEFKDLKDGIYRVYETKAPNGYEGLSTYFEIEIRNGKIYFEGKLEHTFTIVNTNDGTTPEVLGDEIGDRPETEVEGVETSDDQNLYGYGTVALISMLGILFLGRRRKEV